ncbi:autophagy-related protein 16 isoform X2 [Hypomesus transpacificus]|uniref:autophagy-related protein 16 isoform X2 n=1 Tax=Hypomesus transpacificus TaxID=137520 RepID=UPI001F085C59|nr:autophagy-related protein 16 isoform X2 [Hypomesus transpacificus]
MTDFHSCKDDVGQTDACARRVQHQLKESEHLKEKLSQTVSDLTTVLYLKEAEILYWQSQVSRYRKEALTLAKRANALQANLSDSEFTVEVQAKELAVLRVEQRELKEALGGAWREKDDLLERWMEEKREEAERVNKNNDVQDRWHRFSRRLNRHLHREMGKQTSTPPGTSVTEPSPASPNDCPDVNRDHTAESNGSPLWRPS